MITQNCIQNITDQANIVEVVGDFVKLKKAGVNYTGCCPFHDEKTPSFVVSPSKQIFKCFGCGKGGSSVSFLMEHERLTFVDAIKFLGDKYNIEIEYDKSFDKEKYEAAKDEAEQIIAANTKALEIFRSALEDAPEQVKAYISSRFTQQQVLEFQIGYNPDEYSYLSSRLINAGMYEAGLQAGLIAEKSGSVYDKYRGRVIFPILDRTGRPISFGGRVLDDRKPKYLNGPENVSYHKSRVLYGLNLAARSIQQMKFAYLVEGYTDVTSMHHYGFPNTIGTCGTALTEEQILIIKRYTSTVVLLRDGDAAGLKAMKRDTCLLIRHGLSVKAVILPDGEDPDSFPTFFSRISLAAHSSMFGFESYYEYMSRQIDAVLYLFDDLIRIAGEDVTKRAIAVDEVTALLRSMPVESVRNLYRDKFCKTHGIKSSDIKFDKKKKISAESEENLISDDEQLKSLSKEQRDEYFTFGFFEVRNGAKTGYYFRDGFGGKFVRRTNFVIDPLYHVFGADNRRMIKVSNGVDADEVVEITSKSMLSPDSFFPAIYDRGHFMPLAGMNKDQLLKLHEKVGNRYPKVFEITTLGWQPEGFFAFQNKVYLPAAKDEKGQLAEYNEFGIAKIGDRMFLSPSLSKAFDGDREGNNLYENDLYLQWKQSGITFSEWSELMCNVYGKNAWMGIAWCVATIMKDIVEKTARVPHLNPYGQKGSGKSEFANSIQYLFFSGKDSFGDLYKPMNLNQGTDFAFFNRYERFSNTPNVLNEFDENGIKDEWFRAIKSSYDGEGREKGKGKSNQTTSQKIRSTTVIIGQYLSTKDDNSVLSRSLPLSFKLEDSRPEQQVMFFRKLKEHEDAGLSSILCELMDIRPEFARSFSEVFFGVVKELQQQLADDGVQTIDRILKNVSMMLACVKMISKSLSLPFTEEEFTRYAKDYTKSVTGLITKTSKLAEFWKIVEGLIDMNVLEEGYDFDVKTGAMSVKILDGRNDQTEISFSEPTDLLFLRFGAVHGHYEKEFRSRTGQKATNDETVKLYLQEQKYYIGTKKSHKFHSLKLAKETNTSCLVLNLNKMDLSLMRSSKSADNREQVDGLVGAVLLAPTETTLKGNYSFNIRCVDTITQPGKAPVYDEYVVRCFTPNPMAMQVLKEKDQVTLSGMMAKTNRGGRVFRSMSVTQFEVSGVVYANSEGQKPIDVQDDLPF